LQPKQPAASLQERVDTRSTIREARPVLETLSRFARRHVALATVVPSLIVLYVFLHYYADFVSDDAYISFRYAEHLATGRGLEWNPGYRVEGYTNFLWVVLMAGLRVLGVAVPLAARALAWLAAGASLVLIVIAARREAERPSLLLLALAPLPVALSFPFQLWTALRLETTCFAMLLLLSVVLFVIEEERHRGPRWVSALAYLALALTRPEGAVFIAVPGVYLLSRIRSRERLRQVWSERWRWLAVFAGGMVLYTGWRLIYFGHLLPNTYHAKVGGDALTRGWDYVTRFVEFRPATFIMLVGALLVGATASRMGALLLGTVLTLAAVVVLEGGDWMREFRLLVPAGVLLAALLAVGLQRLARESLLSRLAPAAGMLLLCLFLQATTGTPREEWRAAWGGARRDVLINLEGELTQASRLAGEWLRAHARPGDLVAVNHAGAVPFYADLPTLDMIGLNDLHIARLKGERHARFDVGYVLSHRPAFVVLNTRSQPVNGVYVPGYWIGETALFNHPEFRRLYRAAPGAVWAWRHRSMDARNAPGHGTAWIMIFQRTASSAP